MDLSVFFAGTAGSVPAARRGLPALLLRRGGHRVLFDCGEGTQRQLLRSVGLADLDDVFITHFHVDHWLGLPGMLKTFDLRDRDRPLTVHGPPGLRELLSSARITFGRLRFELRIVELEPWESVQRDDFEIAAVPVDHGARAYGYAMVEARRPGRFDAGRARALGVREGPDFGRLQRGEAVGEVTPDQVLGAPRAGRKVVVSGDTAPCEAMALAAQGADLLVHEATFAESEADRAAQTRHSTAAQAARLALDAEVGVLALVHISTRYFGREIREEARTVFARTEVPRDFDAVEVPLPERGEPTLVRWDERPREPAPA